MKEIDCLGEMCPIPIIKIKQALKKMCIHESVKVITDHSCVLQSIVDHFQQTTISTEYEEVMNGIWEIVITKN
ncbi:sulfurtransferase TusA family protein [Clostridiaceae bacterium 35-E11]